MTRSCFSIFLGSLRANALFIHTTSILILSLRWSFFQHPHAMSSQHAWTYQSPCSIPTRLNNSVFRIMALEETQTHKATDTKVTVEGLWANGQSFAITATSGIYLESTAGIKPTVVHSLRNIICSTSGRQWNQIHSHSNLLV